MSGVVIVSNGRVLYTGVAPMSVAILECNEGYRPTFDLNRTCMFGGQWSEGTLSCELITVVSPSQGPLGVCFIFVLKINLLVMDVAILLLIVYHFIIHPTISSCPLYSCIVPTAVVVSVLMAVLIILCIVLTVCSVKHTNKGRGECSIVYN